MKKINTNTFRSILEFLELTKKSNIINSWLLGINSAILLYLINNVVQSTEFLEDLILNNLLFKYVYILLFVWLSINEVLLLVYTYKEKVLSLTIEDKYYRLKSFISYMDNIDFITDEELLDKDISNIHKLTSKLDTKDAINYYTNKIIKYNKSILKWSNKRYLIYKFVVLASIPLLIASFILFYNSVR
ncbi:hypothetical protein [Mesoflavibacter sp. CH_XMU1404-2]|uniref:hypothetical protein n=1 Tax=Mesoflavibacter sp. CH_XMU1404-2 TaxID=3107766 RepID=UPI00300A3CA9